LVGVLNRPLPAAPPLKTAPLAPIQLTSMNPKPFSTPTHPPLKPTHDHDPSFFTAGWNTKKSVA